MRDMIDDDSTEQNSIILFETIASRSRATIKVTNISSVAQKPYAASSLTSMLSLWHRRLSYIRVDCIQLTRCLEASPVFTLEHMALGVWKIGVLAVNRGVQGRVHVLYISVRAA